MSVNKILGFLILGLLSSLYYSTNRSNSPVDTSSPLKDSNLKIVEEFAEFVEKNPEIMATSSLKSKSENLVNDSASVLPRAFDESQLNNYEVIFEELNTLNDNNLSDSEYLHEYNNQVYQVIYGRHLTMSKIENEDMVSSNSYYEVILADDRSDFSTASENENHDSNSEYEVIIQSFSATE